uniref:Vacuolar protein-sorting protein n=1 Tax=Rhipicephalus zambeziensis TaxID=60191 RepID=A0A224Z3G9_9ACAR
MEADNGDQDQELSDEEEEMEPKLRYERILNDMPEILRNGAASCIAVHPKFIALGMHSGVVYILDHQGNNIRNKELQLHKDSVLQLSIDEQGDHLASCSRDGKVVIHGLYTSDHNQVLTFDRPVGAVAIDPNFYRSGSGRRFVTGIDKVVLYEKGFLSRYRTTILHQGEGPVRNISWKGRFAAWATDLVRHCTSATPSWCNIHVAKVESMPLFELHLPAAHHLVQDELNSSTHKENIAKSNKLQ